MEEQPEQVASKIDEEPSSLGDWLVWLVFQGIGFSFMVALLSLFGSTFGGAFGPTGGHWGWCAGALLAAVGYPLGWVRMENAKLTKVSAAEQEEEERKPRNYLGPLKGSLAGLILGAILGLMLGMFIFIFCLSIAMSPFAPDSWRANLISAALQILGWTAGILASGGLILGLCGNMQGSFKGKRD